MHSPQHIKEDLEYMSSLSQAVLQKTPFVSKMIIWAVFISIFWLILWAYFAEVDELARGEGKVIPSKHVQLIQNLEGGIVSEILVEEGEVVQKNQILLKINDTSFSSSYEETHLRFLELQAKNMRLDVESQDGVCNIEGIKNKELMPFLEQEEVLCELNKKQLEQKIGILQEHVNQRKLELEEAKLEYEQLKSEYTLINQEVNITRPLVKKGIVSQVEFLQLSRQASSLKGKVNAVELTFTKLSSKILEAKREIAEAKTEYIRDAKKELNDVKSEMSRIVESSEALEDRVDRTAVRSPVKGIVQRLLVNTVNGVVQPGKDIVEIIPLDDNLLVETKIKPSDIAYLFAGQNAMVKFTAYDFSIYGALKGKVTHISADTITDDDGNSFYLVRIKTNKSYLEFGGEKYDLLIGMIASVDIITGKKSVLDFLLKPILKVQQAALRER
ncbi:HlyD family type I secretion periplasmic adaptor subunit [Sulfurimonas sp.]|jgi:membrane fusion protein, adhesin transport system|uniref:HlyD family type I secretion periplasmic adaptor subunit n=1 Tax=Sulfurimonas sp. TaxID=2022749 RepID=UPI0025EBBCCF|nr:HlyD family type I secretion periplasmic adaptor subunit [Sulfurimonas sp.]MBT5935332.1 HlyD family type I secretion periplasmic adaptor subunit [Sulfurimonas sp.]